MIHRKSPEQFDLLLLSVQKPELIVIREKDHARMRMKGQQYNISLIFLCDLPQPVQDPLMAKMYAIKSSSRNNRSFNFRECVNIVMNFQRGISFPLCTMNSEQCPIKNENEFSKINLSTSLIPVLEIILFSHPKR